MKKKTKIKIVPGKNENVILKVKCNDPNMFPDIIKAVQSVTDTGKVKVDRFQTNKVQEDLRNNNILFEFARLKFHSN